MLKRILLICFLAAVFGIAGTAQVSAMIHHNGHSGHKSVSPFDVKTHSLDCLLIEKESKPLCPKKSIPVEEKNQTCAICCECGGSPFPKVPASINIDSNPLESLTLHVFVPTEFRKTLIFVEPLNSASVKSIKPPPKLS